jgi:hypothetical protein
LEGTRYDRFWVESIGKKYNTIEKIDSIVDVIKELPAEDTVAEFEKAWETLNQTEAEKA